MFLLPPRIHIAAFSSSILAGSKKTKHSQQSSRITRFKSMPFSSSLTIPLCFLTENCAVVETLYNYIIRILSILTGFWKQILEQGIIKSEIAHLQQFLRITRFKTMPFSLLFSNIFMLFGGKLCSFYLFKFCKSQ